MSHVEYRGHKFTLARQYADVRDYNDDVEKLTAAQAELASSLIRKAPFGPNFKDASALFAALDSLRFPGYGSFFANQMGAKSDSRLELSYVELPKASANRYLVTEVQPDGTYLVVADFMAPSDPEITSVSRGKNGELQFRGESGRTVIPR